MAWQLGHLTGFHISLISRPLALLPQDSQSHLHWELLFLLLLICLQTTTKQPVTGPQFISVCLRCEPEYARQNWATGAKGLGSREARAGLRGAAGAWGGARDSEDSYWKYQLQRHDEKRRSGPVSYIWCPRFLFLPRVRGHTLDQHWEQNNKVKVAPVHLEKPASQHLSILSGNHQNMTFYQIALFAFFHEKVGSPWTGSMCSQFST